jgi:hypothetical protein
MYVNKFISETEERALAPTGNANTWILQKSLAHGTVLPAFLFIRHPWRLPSLTSSRPQLPLGKGEEGVHSPIRIEFYDLRREAKPSPPTNKRPSCLSVQVQAPHLSSSFPRPCPGPHLEIRITAIAKSFVSCRSQMKRQSKRPTSSHGSTEPGTIQLLPDLLCFMDSW